MENCPPARIENVISIKISVNWKRNLARAAGQPAKLGRFCAKFDSSPAPLPLATRHAQFNFRWALHAHNREEKRKD